MLKIWIPLMMVFLSFLEIPFVKEARAIPNCPPGEICDIFPEPSPNSPPDKGRLELSNRTETTLTVSWVMPERATDAVLERLENGVWVEKTRDSSFNDVGLNLDTRYCYRLKASNSFGSSTSNPVCTYTKNDRRNLGSQFRNVVFSRVVLQITTGGVNDAGTDDNIWAVLTGSGAGQFNDYTRLEHARNDFERSTIKDYDLVLGGITELDDIHGIKLIKDGNDDWCVKRVSLLVDNLPILSKDFGSSCEWVRNINGETGINISHEELRESITWRTLTQEVVLNQRLDEEKEPNPIDNSNGTVTYQLKMPREELEARVEATVGHTMYALNAELPFYKKVFWGDLHGRPVEAKMINNSTANFDLDLAALHGATEVDIDFDLIAGTRQDSSGNWHLDLDPSNATANIDWDWWLDILDQTPLSILPCAGVSVYTGEIIPFCLSYLAEQIASSIEANFPDISQSTSIGRLRDLNAIFDVNADLIIYATVDSNMPPLAASQPSISSEIPSFGDKQQNNRKPQKPRKGLRSGKKRRAAMNKPQRGNKK